uniref:Uncharacterized protein n=1 Tax=Ananas comosus var. bracteatus TaxID=296719 RepID=A0A6V7NHV2_ANACO|nr:unnamed protein product [Ananas comosus var. bracteatus]
MLCTKRVLNHVSPPSNFASSFSLFFLFSISHGFRYSPALLLPRDRSGPNKTSFIVRGTNLTSHEFGDIVVFDIALRSARSELEAHRSGSGHERVGFLCPTISSDTDKLRVHEGEYKGSTLTLFGRVPAVARRKDGGRRHRAVPACSGLRD